MKIVFDDDVSVFTSVMHCGLPNPSLEQFAPPNTGLPLSNVGKAEREAEQHARAKKAADLMLTEVAVAREDQLLRDAIAPMMKAPHKLVAIVDEEGRLVGALDRADILRGLVQD